MTDHVQLYQMKVQLFKAQADLFQAQIAAHIGLFNTSLGVPEPITVWVEGCDMEIDAEQASRRQVLNEIILHGAWVALTYMNREVNPRFFARLKVIDNGAVVFKDVVIVVHADTTVDGASIGAFAEGGERLYLSFDSGSHDLVTGQHISLNGRYLTVGDTNVV